MGEDAAELGLRPAGAASVRAQFERVLDTLTEKIPGVPERREPASEDILAFTAFPRSLWRQVA